MEEVRAATQEKMEELYDVVHSLQEELDGGTMDEEHMLTIEHGSINIHSKARTRNESVENQPDKHKKKCDKFDREKNGVVDTEAEKNEKSDITFPEEG
jgi:hypothetical protein